MLNVALDLITQIMSATKCLLQNVCYRMSATECLLRNVCYRMSARHPVSWSPVSATFQVRPQYNYISSYCACLQVSQSVRMHPLQFAVHSSALRPTVRSEGLQVTSDDRRISKILEAETDRQTSRHCDTERVQVQPYCFTVQFKFTEYHTPTKALTVYNNILV